MLLSRKAEKRKVDIYMILATNEGRPPRRGPAFLYFFNFFAFPT